MPYNKTTPDGQFFRLNIQSAALAENMIGDADHRDVLVYVPYGHDGKDLPLLVDLAGFTGSGLAHANWRNFGESLPHRLDRLIAEGTLPPVVVAMPDGFTGLGGNQYVNSKALGRWEDFLIEDMLPAIEGKFGCGGEGRRGLFGRSSGGYGAIYHAMKYPDVWSAAGVYSADMGFDWVYLPDMPKALRALAPHDMNFETFLKNFEKGPHYKSDDIHALMLLAMGASYNPDPAAYCGVSLPVDLHTCELDEAKWAAWKAYDPLVMLDQYGDNLKKLKMLWIESGDRDRFNMVYTARQMHKQLEARGIEHGYEEFPDDHFSLDYRYDHSLPKLVKALNS